MHEPNMNPCFGKCPAPFRGNGPANRGPFGPERPFEGPQPGAPFGPARPFEGPQPGGPFGHGRHGRPFPPAFDPESLTGFLCFCFFASWAY